MACLPRSFPLGRTQFKWPHMCCRPPSSFFIQETLQCGLKRIPNVICSPCIHSSQCLTCMPLTPIYTYSFSSALHVTCFLFHQAQSYLVFVVITRSSFLLFEIGQDLDTLLAPSFRTEKNRFNLGNYFQQCSTGFFLSFFIGNGDLEN